MAKISNYTIFTFSFEGAPLALKLQDEGKDVVLAVIEDYEDCYTKGEKCKPEDPEEKKLRMTSFDGMVKKIDAKKAVANLLKVPESERSSHFIFFDFNHCFKFAEQLSGKGFNGNFPTEEDRTMEVDRAMAKKIAEDNYPGLEVPENEEFKKAEDGIKFLEESDDLWVLKGFDEDAETVVPDEDNKDEIELCKKQIINKLKDDSAMYEKSGFTLEKYIPDIIELTPEIQFYNGKPLFATLDIELKRIGNKNTGFMTGCAGDLVFQIPLDCELVKMSFPKFVYDMAKKHKGWFVWDASLLFDENDDAYFGEYCFDPETEIFTRSGWKKYQDIKVGEETLSINPKNGVMEWKNITRIVVKEHHGDMVHIGGDGHAMDALVTPDHQFWKVKNGKFYRERAGSLTTWDTSSFIPRTGIWNGLDVDKITISELPVYVPERQVKKGEWIKENGKKVATHSGERNYGSAVRKVNGFLRHVLPSMKFDAKLFCKFLGMWLAEGCFVGYYNGEPRSVCITQSMKSSRRYDIEQTIKMLGLKYRVEKNGTFTINNRRLAKYMWCELGLANTHANDKFIPQTFKEMSVSHLRELVMGFALGDGSYNKNQWALFTTSVKLTDDLQEIIHKIGWVSNIKKAQRAGTIMTINGKSYTRNFDGYSLGIREKKTGYTIQKSRVKTERYDGTVWDVTVADNESLFVRRNGKAFFSSNCANRCGYNAIYTILAHFATVSDFFEAIVDGKNPFDDSAAEFATSLRLFNTRKKVRSIDYDKNIENDVWLMDALKDGDRIKSVGYLHDLAVITGVGDTIEEAAENMYDNVGKFSFSGKIYRTDFLDDFNGSIMNRYKYYENLG